MNVPAQILAPTLLRLVDHSIGSIPPERVGYMMWTDEYNVAQAHAEMAGPANDKFVHPVKV